MELSAAVTLQRPGKAPLDLNSVRDPASVGSAPLSGYSVEQVDFSSVPVTAFSEDTPLVDGIDSYDPYLGGRQINMIIFVYGNTVGDFWDKVNDLNEAMQAQPKAADTGTYPALEADGRRKLSFTQISDAASDYSLYMMVRPLSMPRSVTEKSASSGIESKGYAAIFQVSLLAEDPYKYFSSTRSFTRTGSGSISVINSGTTVVWPTVTWANATSATLSATLGADTVSHSAVSTSVTDTFKTATSTSPTTLTAYEFFSINPGTSNVSVTAASAATVTITISEALV